MNAAETYNLFTYGTLTDRNLVYAITGIWPESTKAILRNHARYLVIGTSYPAIIEQPGFNTSGILYYALTEELLQKLDLYEGTIYERVFVRVVTDVGEILPAETYRIKSKHLDKLSSEPMD